MSDATEAEQIAMLIKAGRLYHEALDQAFAMLIMYTRAGKRDTIEPFFPAKSPMWEKMTTAKLTIDTIEAMQANKQ